MPHIQERHSNLMTATAPAPLRPARLRAGVALAIAVALAAFAMRAQAQQSPSPSAHTGGILDGSPLAQPARSPGGSGMADVPFAVGEELVYHAKFGAIPAGSAHMRVAGIDTVRGRAAYHVMFSVDGGIPFFHVHDRYESWIDVQTLSSLRHEQHISEGRYHRNTTYEIMPDLREYRKNDGPPQPSVRNPLDDGSFIYAVRAAGIGVGETVRDDRYFVPDRNPVVLTGLREDTVTVGAGTFPSVVVHPSIKSGGIFSQNGDAQVWFSDDARRLPVLVKTHFAHFSLTLSLTSVTEGSRP